MRLVILAAILAVFLVILGCAGAQPFACSKPYTQVGSVCCLDQNGNGICDRDEQAQAAQGNVLGGNETGGAGGIAGAQAGAKFSEWKAPDGSMTLQVPEGWKASERRTDNCTVSWEARDAAGTASAFMSNQIMVLKSESARQMYKTYGLAGIDSSPVAGYLDARQAFLQVVASLAGAKNVQLAGSDAAASQKFSQATCISGLAACDAQIFDASFDYNGTRMRGRYFMQTYDFGEGTTWWINLWGYEAPDGSWENSAGTLEKMFASASYTDEWAAKCSQVSGNGDDVVREVIKSRQAASEKSAEEWDNYIKGE
ncbi:MAG: hypothetical protein NT051_04195 [Candidatus Micrarchaeota archaeon]|nr:hypothetical protein [Candidatus Micrarchaeota archaeon]